MATRILGENQVSITNFMVLTMVKSFEINHYHNAKNESKCHTNDKEILQSTNF